MTEQMNGGRPNHVDRPTVMVIRNRLSKMVLF